MEIIRRCDAKKKGLYLYFTGMACKYGHIAPRKVINAACVKCENDYKKQKQRTDGTRELERTYAQKRPDIGMFNQAKRRAKEQGVPFTITYDDIVFPEFCPVFGVKLERGAGRPGPNSPSLDRIIPELGYVPGNVCVISHRANTIKNNATISELQQVIEYIKTYMNDLGLCQRY